MQIIEITDKNQLNDFVGSQPMSQFLQSWQWGEFQEKVSGRVWRFGVLDQDRLAASAKVITKDLPMGKRYFYCGRGPIISAKADKKSVVQLLFEKIKTLAGEEEIMFLRFDPTEKFIISNLKPKIIKTLDVQPSQTIMLDLTKTETELLRGLSQKTRYNIKLAMKKGVKVVQSDLSGFEEFWNLLAQTSDRDKFMTHGRSYYRAMLEINDNPIKLFFAKFRGKPIATALVSFFGDTAAYLHGGSADEERNTMAPHLLQWEIIKLAKADGRKFYDFYGIDEERWPGVTRFKRGFGGFEVVYPGTFDLVYDRGWYSIYKMVRKVRRTF